MIVNIALWHDPGLFGDFGGEGRTYWNPFINSFLQWFGQPLDQLPAWPLYETIVGTLLIFGAGPAFFRPTVKVELDGRDRCLDRGPERPADIRHDHLESHPREQGVGGLTEVGGAQLGDPVSVPTLLLARVAKLERRIIVAAVLRRRRSRAIRRRPGSSPPIGRYGMARSRADGPRGRLRCAGSDPSRLGSRRGSGCRGPRPPGDSAPTAGTCRSRRESEVRGRRAAMSSRRTRSPARPRSPEANRPGRRSCGAASDRRAAPYDRPRHG